MDRPSRTRAELLAHRTQIALARRGRDLLQDKRRELMRALRQVVTGVLASSDALERAAMRAREGLALAEGAEGPAAIRSAAWASEGDVLVETASSNIMGVQVPAVQRRDVGRPRVSRGYSLEGSSPWIEQVAERFEAEIDLALELVAQELRLKRLAQEIQKTTRRANALEHIVIPRLASQRDAIELALQEREREETLRLHRIKDRQRSRPVATGDGHA